MILSFDELTCLLVSSLAAVAIAVGSSYEPLEEELEEVAFAMFEHSFLEESDAIPKSKIESYLRKYPFFTTQKSPLQAMLMAFVQEGPQGLERDMMLVPLIKTGYPNNLMAKHFDESYFKSLSEDEQAAFLACCRSGIENADSGMGCYAMQPSDYDRFKPFFSQVLASYHGVSVEAKHETDWSLEGVEGLPEDGQLDLAALGLPALSMRVRVGRNLADFPLPGAMSRADRVALESKMCAAFDLLIAMPEYGGRYYSLTEGHKDYVDNAKYTELVKVSPGVYSCLLRVVAAARLRVSCGFRYLNFS